MRRFRAFLSLMVVVLLGVLALRAHLVTVAQEATPARPAMEGVTLAPMGFVQGVTVPSPADLTGIRLGFEPGAGFPLEASDPEAAIVVIESGALTVRVDEVPWTISRGAGPREEIALGEEATLEAGDAAYVPGGVAGEVRNNGQERVEALVFLVSPSGDMAEATPQP
jgi:quercetin dioxygenase-like cupin family protein